MNTVENLLSKRALKRYGDLRNPKILPFSTLEFPRKPLIHIQPVDKDDAGLTPTHPIVNCFDPEEDLYVNQVITFTGMQLPKMYFHNAARNPADAVKGYFRRYTQLNRVFKVPTAMASHYPIINNYGLLGGLWVKPIRDINANLVWNAALYENVLRTSIEQQEYKRPQFILFDLPEILPEFQKILDLVSRESLTEYRKNFGEYKCSSLITLLLWFTNAPKLQERAMVLSGLHDKLDGFIILRDNENSILLSVDLMKTWRTDGSSTPASRIKDFYSLLESIVELRVSIDEDSTGDLVDEPIVDDTDNASPTSTATKVTADTAVVNVDSTAYVKVIERQAEKGKLTTANYNRLIKKAESFKSIPNPVGEGTLEDLLTDNPENWKAVPTVYPDSAVIKHKGWLQDNISNLEGNYIAHQFEADLAGMAMMIQAAGYPVTNYTRELQTDALSTKYLYKIKIEPPIGSSSTLPFTIPAIDENGEYQIDGVRQRNDRQIGEKPIIKIAPTEVVLTSAMCKTFIQRCPRSNFNFTDWIGKQINIKAAEGVITEIATSSFDNTVKAPFHYTVLTHQYAELKIGGVVLDMRSHLNKDTTDFSKGIVFGKTADGLDIKMLADCNCIAINKKGEEVRELGTVSEILGLPSEKAPKEFATLKFWRKEIPVGVFISYLIGIEAFLTRIGVPYLIKEKGERHVATGTEYVIKFKDKLLIVSPSTVTQELLVYGFEYYKANLTNYRMSDFKERVGFTGLLGGRGLTVDHLMELDLFETNFIDPITRRLLTEMGEPTEYLKLLVRAVSLLEYEQHRIPSDGYNYIDKGYSRLTEIAYREFMQGIRQFRRANARDTAKLTINPNAVARKISEDAAGTLIEEINPLHSTTERERCTFNGDGGRKPGVVNGELRRFSANDIGRVSEANVDNGNVGSIRWTSANPRYKNAYGMAETYEQNKDVDAANVLSPYAMLMPYSTHDD